MLLRIAAVCFAMLLLVAALRRSRAQDVPGIEICTVEKTMERRTSCLQSNVDFLQKTITKLNLDHQQKLDAANRQIDALKVTWPACRRPRRSPGRAGEEGGGSEEEAGCAAAEGCGEIGAGAQATRYRSITLRSGS